MQEKFVQFETTKGTVAIDPKAVVSIADVTIGSPSIQGTWIELISGNSFHVEGSFSAALRRLRK